MAVGRTAAARSAAAGALFLLGVTGAAPAQDYPAKPVRLISAHAAGGGADQLSRLVSTGVMKSLPVPVVVENKPGASTMIAAEYVANAAPDGYTLLMATVTTLSINPALFPKIRYDAVKDFAPLTVVASTPFFVGTHPSLPAKNLRELIQLAKNKPGMLNVGSSGNGTSSHLAGELFNDMAGVRTTHVPYKATATRATDLVSGIIQVAFANDILPFAQAGRVRILAVTSARRLSGYPEIPTVAEAGGLPGYEASVWYGLVAPARTPASIVNKWHQTVGEVLADAEVKRKIMSILGGEVIGNSPAEFAALITSDLGKWARVIKRANVKLD
ncbi:MAG: tripartite tricarboxylate transporter substrate binding protein [Burkholderiales bacterium]|nr:tripartite tricarboxylate transporter substrate binding protein [Burkholderiales bacterium]